jgi:hypothetical protein
MFSTLVLNVLTAKVLPVVVPFLVAAVRKWVLAKVPPQFIPFLLTLGGSGVGAAAEYLGATEQVPADLAMLGAGAWEGALVGLAATGVHQGWKQAREWLKGRKKADG